MSEFLVVQSPTFHWAVSAASVKQVVLQAEWAGAAPIDVFARLKLSHAIETGVPRVVVLQHGHTRIALKASSPLELRRYDEAQLSPLPRITTPPRLLDAVQAIVISGDEPSRVLVLGAEGLERLAQTTTFTST